MFEMANNISQEQGFTETFDCQRLTIWELDGRTSSAYTAIIFPPSNASEFYLSPPSTLITWAIEQHKKGAILASACAGTFILAATHLLDGKQATTHWGLAALFEEKYPTIELTVDKILVNEFDVITAGGMMSWLDLGLELVAQLGQPRIMRQLGKRLVVDTGTREQRYYQQFTPILNHGDETVVLAQHYLQAHLSEPIAIATLARQYNISERTFLRRFVSATKLKPNQYLQQLRVQKSCDLLETTRASFESIAYQVGYEDVSGCRKLFVRTMGLTPSAFRQRFVG